MLKFPSRHVFEHVKILKSSTLMFKMVGSTSILSFPLRNSGSMNHRFAAKLSDTI